MAAKKQSSYIPGIFLVLIGLFILSRNLHWYYFGAADIVTFGLMILGILFFFKGVTSENKGGIFPGTVLFLYGLWLTMMRYRLIYNRMDTFWPLFIIIPGIAFFVTFLFKPRAWHLLIPGSILITVGGLFILSEMGYLRFWEIGYWIGTYWPLILIVIGITILLKGLTRNQLHLKNNE